MDNKQDFTQGSIFGKMLHFMLPILGALVLQAMYGAVDLLIVGRFGTNAGISAVSTGSSIMNLASIFSSIPQDIARAAEYLKGFAPEAVVTCILFSFMGYFNGHSRSLFVMLQGLAQSFLVRLPVSYLMSVQPKPL